MITCLVMFVASVICILNVKRLNGCLFVFVKIHYDEYFDYFDYTKFKPEGPRALVLSAHLE